MAMKQYLSAVWARVKPYAVKKRVWVTLLTSLASLGLLKLNQVEGLSNIVSGALTLLSIILGG